ncbi:putative RNA-directed DNA polymerase from transposon BS [Aphis craccivora]|uniref:Putative RNA-directed DNA polymerase from transposon BS n=1 Tax=Aphis craccivora TaxID=307492 RepID=A0A6G0Y461_APHCR|nr:putative RNA-directed DNA polymerase from transposon BS [Aphis craccivora]
MTLFIQWNINGFYKRSETNLKNNPQQVSKVTPNRCSQASGGVATFIKDTIDSENVPIISDLEAIATLVKFNKPLCICNIYIPDSKILTKQQLKNIIKQLPKPFVLLGDFNSRNTSWGCNYTDHRGHIVEEFLEEETLILLNNNEPTRHNVSNGNFSTIDLTISSINSTTLFDWKVLPAYSDSEHWPIEIQYQSHPEGKKCSTKWNLKNPIWELFSEKIEFELNQNLLDLNAYVNQLEMDTIVRKFTDIIIEAANLSIGLKTSKNLFHGGTKNPNRSRLKSQTLTNKPFLNDKLLASNKQLTQTNKFNFTTTYQAITQPTSNSSINNFQGKSFAETTANSYTPKIEQAIVMNSVDGIKRIKQIQYIIALNKITDATNIISASCISNNRQQIANDIINKHSAIYIDNIEISIRKLINPSKRIIISNVYPTIPNNIIIEVLVNLDIKITFPITALKAGFQLDQFAHITSFRRQLYINPEDFSKLPGSIAITSDNTTYRIFITDDTVTCFLCKRKGHVLSSCKTSLYQKYGHPINDDSTILSSYYPSSEITPNIKETPNQVNDTTMLNINYTNISEPQDHQVIKKRPAPKSTCPSSTLSPLPSSFNMETQDIQQGKNKTTKEKKITKKTKIRSRSSSSTLGSNATNIQNLIEQIRPILTDRSIKTKITKLSNLLFQRNLPKTKTKKKK